jgi:CBS domain-containing protein
VSSGCHAVLIRTSISIARAHGLLRLSGVAAEAKREPQGPTAEYHDEYSETLGVEVRKLEDALLSDMVSALPTRDPIRLDETAGIEEALSTMLAQDQLAVLVVDREGRLAGIATDRDLLKRVRDTGYDAKRAQVGAVMTRDPEAIRPDDRICYAVNRMMGMRCRTIPVVDEARRPVGIVTVEDIAAWLATLFPEATLNLRPGDRLKQPSERDGG